MPDTRNLSSGTSSQLLQDYETQQSLLEAQPTMVQRFLQMQAQQIAEGLIQRAPQVRFTLPDKIVEPARESRILTISNDQREQMAGGLMDRLTRTELKNTLRQRLTELEQSPNQAIALAGALVRHATAIHMVHNMLPAGRSVRYIAAAGEEIPTIPRQDALEPESAITATTDAIAEEGQGEEGRGELLVPYVPAARRFFLPQWVAFGDHDELLVNNSSEAEAHLVSMERYIEILHTAVHLAPYMVEDEDYQEKRYGMLGQLINQGRALARFQTREIVHTIQQRSQANELNRGLSLSLPFFDDQDLTMKTHSFEVIPAGRIMFVPAFVVRAAREELAKVAQDTRLSPSTRKHLMDELRILEESFDSSRVTKKK